MARVRQSSSRSDLRIGRLRFWRPQALLSLSSIQFDPHVNARCANGGTEALSWLLRIEGDSLTTGSARPSIDGKTFWLATDTLAGPSECPGFPGTAISVAPVTASLIRRDSGFSARIDALNIALFRDGYALPFRDVVIDVPAMNNPSCIGAWNPRWWCDGDSLGWTTGGKITAKITLEDSDRIPIKPAGCQSLCAILVNDAARTDGKVCKRDGSGKLPEIGDACVGATDCKNAFAFTMTFAAYGIDLR